MRDRRSLAGICLLLLAAVGCGGSGAGQDAIPKQFVKLPGGQQIQVEVVYKQADMARGMMFRDHLAPDRGMLFLHAEPGKYPYWMYNCKIALDILWLDQSRRIAEISANTPPCPGPASQCPQYGGNVPAQFVLELAAGMAERYGLKLGDEIRF